MLHYLFHITLFRFNGNFIVDAFPLIVFGPEKCKLDGSALLWRDRNIHEVACHGHRNRIRIVRRTPFVGGPAQAKFRRRLNAQCPPSPYRTHAPVWFPDLQLLAYPSIAKMLRHFGNEVEHPPVLNASQELDVFSMGPH